MILSATVIPDANVVLNVLTVLLLVFAAPRLFRSKRVKDELGEKDRVIETHRQSIDALETRIGLLEGEMAGMRNARQHAEAEAIRWHAAYEEQSKYTAREALAEVSQQLGRFEELMRMWITQDAARGLVTLPERPAGESS